MTNSAYFLLVLLLMINFFWNMNFELEGGNIVTSCSKSYHFNPKGNLIVKLP